MSVTLTPYGDSTYGAANYSGITVGGFSFFDVPSNAASIARGSTSAAMFDANSPVKV